MYSDSFLNFYQTTENEGLDRGAVILSTIAARHPYFCLDTGTRQDDIWKRVERIKQCIELMVNEDEQRSIKSMIHFAAGIMPDTETVYNRFQAVETLEETINDFKTSGSEYADRLVAIGPCGIDHDWESADNRGREHDYFDNSTVEDERDLFALQLTLGKKYDMPVIVHTRKGYKDTLDVVKAIKWNKGIIHGFSYSQPELEYFLNLGWYISFSGSVTYAGKKNFQDMSDIVAYVPKNRIIVESDAPFYAPVPIKAQDNTPDTINYIYEYIASKRNISARKLSEIVDDNFKTLFHLK